LESFIKITILVDKVEFIVRIKDIIITENSNKSINEVSAFNSSEDLTGTKKWNNTAKQL
jgi:hypothetical protein